MRYVATALAVALVASGPAGAEEDADAFAEEALRFIRQHCVDPMLAAGAPDAGDLPLAGSNGGVARFERDGDYRTLSVVTGGDGIPPGCTAGVMAQPPDVSVEAAEARARRTEARLSGYVLNTLDAGLVSVLRHCLPAESGRFFQAPHLTAARVTMDGTRAVLVTGVRQGARITVSAIDFGTLAGCGDPDGQ